MRDRQVDVFIQMKQGDLAPLDGAVLHEMVERLKLAGSGGYNDIGETSGTDRGADDAAGGGGGQTAKRWFVGGFDDLHAGEKMGRIFCAGKPRGQFFSSASISSRWRVRMTEVSSCTELVPSQVS